MLTPYQKAGLVILKYGFWYMVPLPIEWDVERGLYKVKVTIFRLFFAIMTHGAIGFNALCSFYVVGTHSFIRARMELTRVELALIGFEAVGCTIIVILAADILLYIRYFKIGNVTIKLIDSVDEKYSITRPNSTTLLEKLMIPGPVTCVIVPWLAILLAMTWHLDPFHFILEDLQAYLWGPNDIYERSQARILALVVIRFVVMLPVICELARVVGIYGSSVNILLFKFQRFLETSLSPGLPCRALMKGYKRSSILYAVWAPVLYPALTSMISSGFWVIVGMWWIAITYFDRFPIVTYLVFISIGGLFTTAQAITITIASTVGETSDKVIEKCRLTYGFKYAGAEEESSRSLMRIRKWEAKGMKRVAVEYYPFQTMDKEFALDVLKNMVDRLVDALLMF